MASVEKVLHHLTGIMGGGIFQGISIEQIVVDDGSNDNTSQIVWQYAENHHWIRFIPLPENRGTNAARNAAIVAAKGEWCVLLDSDDYFMPTALVNYAECNEKSSRLPALHVRSRSHAAILRAKSDTERL